MFAGDFLSGTGILVLVALFVAVLVLLSTVKIVPLGYIYPF